MLLHAFVHMYEFNNVTYDIRTLPAERDVLTPYITYTYVRAKTAQLIWNNVHTYFAAWLIYKSMRRGLHMKFYGWNPSSTQEVCSKVTYWVRDVKFQRDIYPTLSLDTASSSPLPRSWSLLRASDSDRRISMKRASIHHTYHTASLNGRFD